MKYKVILATDLRDLEEILNEWAEDGWEVVCMAHQENTDFFSIILKEK